MTATLDESAVVAKLANEYATIWLQVDRTGNGPRLVVHSLRDHEQVELDPMALGLMCHLDTEVLALLADISRDEGAREEFHIWMGAQRERQARAARGEGVDGGL